MLVATAELVATRWDECKQAGNESDVWMYRIE